MATISGVGTTATVNASSSRSGNTVTVTCTGSVTVNVSAYTGSVYAEVYINGSYVGRIGNANGSKSLSITQTTNAQTVASYAKFYLEETQKSTMTEKTYSGTVTCSNQTIPALTPSSPTVYYSANGGSGAPSGGTTWPSGSNFTVSSTVPTRENYTFNGWAYTYDGITYTVESGGTIPAARRSTMTLYAVWVSRYEDLTGWVISAQRSSQRWLGAAARILLADDSTDGAYHLIAEYSFYQFATSVNEWLNIYKALADGTYQRENIPVTSNYVGVSGLTITEDLGVYGYNETVSTRAFYCRWYPSSGGYLDSYTAQATYTTPVIRYAISYDANGGTGTMSNTVKIAGETVTISACGFAKTDYHFLKWNTAANGSGVDYAAGASFSTDGNLALYAIWEADHVYPYFTNVPSVVRSESNGTASDYGNYLNVSFTWQLDTGFTSATAKIEYKLKGAQSWTTLVSAGALSGNTGTYTYTSGSEIFTNDNSYNVRITLTDSVGSGEPFQTFISSCHFPFDVYGGSSVAIGAPAPESFPNSFKGMLTLGGAWDEQMYIDTTNAVDADLAGNITAAGYTGVYNDTNYLSLKKLLSQVVSSTSGAGVSGTSEFIAGTQTSSTNAWTGATEHASLTDGMQITYFLPYATTSSNATLNLTLVDGETTTGAKPIYRYGTTRLNSSTYAPATSVIHLTYRLSSDAWYMDMDANSDTTYSAGTGLSLSGTTFNHSNSVTAGTIGSSPASSGSTIAVPYATFDAQGHITTQGTHEHRLAYSVYGNAASPGRWYKVCTLPVNNSSNMATLIIEGRFGDYLITKAAHGRFLVGNRNGLKITADYLVPNDSTSTSEALPAAFSKVDVVAYTQTDGTVDVYLKCLGYFFYDFTMRLCYTGGASRDGTFTYDGTFVTTEPGGTLDAQASTATGGVFVAPRVRTSLVQSNTSWYGSCSTAAGTAEKAVSCANFVLTHGAVVHVRHSTANTANVPTLNVNSTGAKRIYYLTARASSSNLMTWDAGECLTYVYNSNADDWVFVGSDRVRQSQLPIATTSALGGVKPDGTTITADADGVISAAYSAGTGLSLSGTTFNHSNAVTAGTAGTSSATSGNTLAVPYVTYDAQGHVTASGTHTHTSWDRQTPWCVGNEATAGRALGIFPYVNIIMNGLYRIDKRGATVTLTNFNSSWSSYGNLFDGNYDSRIRVDDGETGTILIDFTTMSGGHYPGYPYGDFYLTFYYSGTPASVSARVYNGYTSQGVGWFDCTVTDLYGDKRVWRIDEMSKYYLEKLEITIVGEYHNATYPGSDACQLEMRLSRPTANEQYPFVRKYGEETLYYRLTAPQFRGVFEGNSSWYGTCSTGASTAAKVVSCSGFVLAAGARISVLFSNAQTATAPTLNVNSTGAVAVWKDGAVSDNGTNAVIWPTSNTVATFIYTGSVWLFLGADAVLHGPRTQPTTLNLTGRGGLFQHYYLGSSVTGGTGAAGHYLHMQSTSSNYYASQMYLPIAANGKPAWRTNPNGTWTAWDTFYTAANPPAITACTGTATPSQLPDATPSTKGIVQPDGQSIVISNGVITATPAAVGLTCTERKGGVQLKDYHLFTNDVDWPADGGWGWREEVWNDGRLTVYAWKWFATTGSGWNHSWTNIPYPTDSTPFVDVPNFTSSLMEHGDTTNGASMVTWTSLKASSTNSIGFKLTYYNSATTSTGKTLVQIKMEGHWYSDEPEPEPTPAEEWAIGPQIAIGGVSYYPVTEWTVSSTGAGGDNRLKAAVRFLITTTSTSGAWHVYAQYAAWTDTGYMPTSSQNGYMLIRKLNTSITTYTNDAGVKAKGDVWSTLNQNQRQGYVSNGVVEGHLIWGDTPYIITDCGTFGNGETVTSKTFYVGTTETTGGVYTQTSVSDTTTTPTSI